MANLAAARGGDLAFTQLALSLAIGERGTPDTMFEAGRALLDEMRLRNRPTIAVLHGPPAAHLHLHVVVPLVDGVTGAVHSPLRMPRDAWEAARAVAPRYGWEPPRRDDRERRREPRAARSLGVWNGQRSLHAWLGEVAGPRILPRIDAARIVGGSRCGARRVRAALLAHGARCGHRGPQQRAAAPGRCVGARLPCIGERAGEAVGPTPASSRFPRTHAVQFGAYTNDAEGRTLPVGTPADRRAFAAAHATWRAVWLPVRERRLAALRDVHAGRRADLRDRILGMRGVRDELAQNRREWLEANVSSGTTARSQIRTRGPREGGARGPARVAVRPAPTVAATRVVRTRTGTATEVPTLRGPIGAPSRDQTPRRRTSRLIAACWAWTATRNGGPSDAALPSTGSGNRRLRPCRPRRCPRRGQPAVAADQRRRRSAVPRCGSRGGRGGQHVRRFRRTGRRRHRDATGPSRARRGPDRCGDRAAPGPAGARARRRTFRPDHAERQPPQRPGTRSTVAFDSPEVVALAASEASLRSMERAGFVGALEADGAAVFVFDRQTSPEERATLTEALIHTYGLERRELVFIDQPICYHRGGHVEGFRRMLDAHAAATATGVVHRTRRADPTIPR